MESPVKLSNANLARLNGRVKVPNYDRSQLSAGIVHIGVGNFHRAHQAWYVHQLMKDGIALDWAIVGAGACPFDTGQLQKLLAQDGLTTLIELDPEGKSAEVIGPMIDYVPVEDGNRKLIDQLARPEIRIVSLTVTEGGYFLDPLTNEFNSDHPDIVHDAEHPETPRTVFGAITGGLKLRREKGLGPFTGLSCDNLVNNGGILKQTVVSMAELSDPGLADWIDSNCSFPNSMVDCIVPATGQEELALAREFGIEDTAPVTHENFRQWVIEDDFCSGRPELEKAGVTFSHDVHGFESMKLRILNGGHQILANAGELLYLKTISDCMQHPLVGSFFKKVISTDIVPHVNSVIGMTPQEYANQVEIRFRNPDIQDTVRRVAFDVDGSSRHSGFLVPVINDSLVKGTSIDGLSLAEALWARMCAGERENGTVIEPNDSHWNELSEVAVKAKDNPKVWLEQTQYYGNLSQNARFLIRFAEWLDLIYVNGTENALKSYLES